MSAALRHPDGRWRAPCLAALFVPLLVGAAFADEPKAQGKARPKARAVAAKAVEPKKVEEPGKKADARKAERKKGDAKGKAADPAVTPKDLGRPEKVVKKSALTPKDLDEAIGKLLESTGVKPADRTSDPEFCRRAYLDIVGTVPTPDQIRRFVESGLPTKRSKLIEDLLASPEFGHNWGRYWRDVIALRTTNPALENRPGAFTDLQDWLAEQFNKDRPWDEVVTDLITATGKPEENGAAGLMLAHADNNQVAAVELAGEVSRAFLGIQIQCAQCHDHPTDQWKRQQFHEFASFFGGIRARRVGQGGEIENLGRVAYTMPDLKDPQKKIPVEPRFFLEGSAEVKVPRNLPPQARRALAASFVTGQDNPWFPRAFINRVWATLMGEGFNTPIDDMGPGRDSIAPEVLDLLANAWQQGGYDIKWLFRLILNTEAYSRRISSTNTEAGRTSFAANAASRLRGDQIVDALEKVLGVELDQGKGRDARSRARTLFRVDPSTPTDEVQGTIPQALYLMNGPQLQQRIANRKDGIVAQVFKATPDPGRRLKLIYHRILGRDPTRGEVIVFEKYIDKVRNNNELLEAYEDLVWALINSTEFLSRH